MVINTCLINLAVTPNPNEWSGPGGLAEQVFSMCLSNVFASAGRLLDPLSWVRRFHRWRFESRVPKDEELTEAEIEEYYKFFYPTPLDIPRMYATALKTYFL